MIFWYYKWWWSFSGLLFGMRDKKDDIFTSGVYIKNNHIWNSCFLYSWDPKTHNSELIKIWIWASFQYFNGLKLFFWSKSVLDVSLLLYLISLVDKLLLLLSFHHFLAIASTFYWSNISCFFLTSFFLISVDFVKAGLSFWATTPAIFSYISSNQEHIID